MLHIGILAYRAFEDVRLLCESDPPPIAESTIITPTSHPSQAPADPLVPSHFATTSMENNVWIRISGTAGDVMHFSYEIPPGTSGVIARIRRGNGNCDLYASFDRQNVIGAGEDVNDCVSDGGKTSEHCSADKLQPIGNILYVSVYAPSDFTSARLKVRSF